MYSSNNINTLINDVLVAIEITVTQLQKQEGFKHKEISPTVKGDGRM